MAFIRAKQDIKQPYEEWPIDISYSYSGGSFRFPPGAKEIVTSSASALKWHRQDPTNKEDASLEILQSTTPIIVLPDKNKVRIHVKGGVHNYDYQITVRVEFDNGIKLEEELFIRVRED